MKRSTVELSSNDTTTRTKACGKFVAAVFWLAPLLGGCVSAVDDTTAFGFNGSVPAPANTAPDADVADADADAKAADAAVDEASSDADAVAKAIRSDAAEKTKVAQSSAVGPAADTDETIASGRTTIAAYAGATINPSSETDQPDERPAGNKASETLFTSLFAESKAKTPVKNGDVGKSRRVILHPSGAPEEMSETVAMSALPGVKSRASLFEIGQRASADYDSEILEEANGEEGSYEVASLGGMARLAPNGLMVQRPDVDTSCFEPALVSILRSIESKFHTKVVVTSGYRSPSHNKRVNGARRSMHMACKAADIQVPGANKEAVANFVRTLPGRGGVGTYCHTTAVHVDIGRERDWNWSCRRRRA